MLSSVEQACVGREEIRAPLKTPAWEATPNSVCVKGSNCAKSEVRVQYSYG